MATAFKLTEVRVMGEQPSCDVECVAMDTRGQDLNDLHRSIGAPLRFQHADGRVVGTIKGVSLRDGGIAVLKAHVHDADTKNYCVDGVLTGIFLGPNGDFCLCDRISVAKGQTFNIRRMSGEGLAKRFKPQPEEPSPAPLRPRPVVRYDFSNATFPPVRKAANAGCRSGFTRQQTALFYRLMNAKVEKASRPVRVNPNLKKAME